MPCQRWSNKKDKREKKRHIYRKYVALEQVIVEMLYFGTYSGKERGLCSECHTCTLIRR